MPAHLRNKFSWATVRPVSHWCPRQFMAAGGLHQRYSTCGISAGPPRDAKKCRDPGVEEQPNGITVHSLPPTGRRGSFNSNTTTRDLLYQKVVAAHGLLGLSRLSNRKGVKTILPFEMNTSPWRKALLPRQLLDAGLLKRDLVSTAKGQNGVPRASARTSLL